MSMVCMIAERGSARAKHLALNALELAVRADVARRRACRDKSAEAATRVRPWPVV